MNLQFTIPGAVTRKYISENKGRGLFAEKSFEKDEVIFSERPLFSVQHVYNRSTAWTCGNCFKFLGSLNRQLAHYKKLFGIKDQISIPESPDVCNQQLNQYEFQTKVFSCFAKCGEKYCSEECRNLSFYNHHQILCVGEQTAENNPIYLFKKHSIETNELFFLAAQAIAFLICKVGNDDGLFQQQQQQQHQQQQQQQQQQNSTITTTTTTTTSTTNPSNKNVNNMVDSICKEFFQEYTHREWWDVRIDGNFTHEEAKIWSHESLDLLRKALVPILQSNPRTNNQQFIETILSMEFYSHLLGLLEMNDNSIGFSSPLEMFRKNLHQLPISEKDKKQCDKAMESVVEAFRDHHRGEEEECNDDECNDHNHTHGSGGAMIQDDDHDVEMMDDQDEFDDEEEIFPSFDGFGIFGLQAMVNHSCEPNVTVVFSDKDNRAYIKALRKIEANEELTHSYIDESEPYDDRQKELITYGFVCTCPKCLNEKKIISQ
ncbi:hypothetical protein DLAC_04299 [Tieghemostelium lacteum]|uniref:SET domain-containing protein n=1 Tax=Tieghemostelium lacteum TaxID=361077 RepID=A0A151ZJC7_TIELA|nr:hypothetical protein DLAC_04299 [Tieghemostelium lacteum]|eukprot:KYQ94027.1 hypothetical protein DLAC_04299 [Tieghemostelium lacteum]